MHCTGDVKVARVKIHVKQVLQNRTLEKSPCTAVHTPSDHAPHMDPWTRLKGDRSTQSQKTEGKVPQHRDMSERGPCPGRSARSDQVCKVARGKLCRGPGWRAESEQFRCQELPAGHTSRPRQPLSLRPEKETVLLAPPDP